MLWLFQEFFPCVVIPQVTHCAFLSQVRKSQYVSCLVTNKIINPRLRTILLVIEKKYYVEVQRRTVLYVCIHIYICTYIQTYMWVCLYVCVSSSNTYCVLHIYNKYGLRNIYMYIYDTHMYSKNYQRKRSYQLNSVVRIWESWEEEEMEQVGDRKERRKGSYFNCKPFVTHKFDSCYQITKW